MKKLSEIKKDIIIQEDTRNVMGKHDLKNEFFQNNGIKVLRSKLPFGDYAIIDNMSVIVDTKKDLMEVEGNLTKQHIRFRNEIINANNFGIGLVILIEEEIQYNSLDDVAARYKIPKWKSTTYEMINGVKHVKHRKGQPMGVFNVETIIKAMKTMQEKYAVIFAFTTKEKCGEAIIDILVNKRDILDNYFKKKLKELKDNNG